MKTPITWALGITALFLAACTAAAPGESPSTTDGVDYGPFLLDDPFGVITDLSWLGVAPALAEGPIREEGVVAVVMGDSRPDALHIAVNGGGCRPEVYVSVLGLSPELELGIAVGDNIVPPGLQCTDILTTHGFEVALNESVSLDAVAVRSWPFEGEPESPIASGGDLRVIVMPGVDGGLPPDVLVGCRAGPSFPASALEDIPPVDEVELPGLEDAMQEFLSDEEGRHWPQDGWRVLLVAEQKSPIVHHEPATRGISFMHFELQDGSWRWDGASSGGPCRLHVKLPEPLGVVEWRIDPDGQELRPETISITVLASESRCASGQAMGDRLLGPEVVVTDTQVLIAFVARRPPGLMQTCPGNPEQPVTVDLPEPLGDREIIDGFATGLRLADFLE